MIPLPPPRNNCKLPLYISKPIFRYFLYRYTAVYNYLLVCLCIIIVAHYFSSRANLKKNDCPPPKYTLPVVISDCGFRFKIANPDPSWLSDKSWDEICRMCDLDGFQDFRYGTANMRLNSVARQHKYIHANPKSGRVPQRFLLDCGGE